MNPTSLQNAILKGLDWLVERTHAGREFAASPIGFYFAKLWYYEKLYPIVYTLAAAGRALALSEKLHKDATLEIRRLNDPVP